MHSNVFQNFDYCVSSEQNRSQSYSLRSVAESVGIRCLYFFVTLAVQGGTGPGWHCVKTEVEQTRPLLFRCSFCQIGDAVIWSLAIGLWSKTRANLVTCYTKVAVRGPQTCMKTKAVLNLPVYFETIAI